MCIGTRTRKQENRTTKLSDVKSTTERQVALVANQNQTVFKNNQRKSWTDSKKRRKKLRSGQNEFVILLNVIFKHLRKIQQIRVHGV
jgi:hypothetical protein